MDISCISSFAGYDVQIKTGNCTVDKNEWNRNDFPFWKYFEEATNAESLNSWKMRGKDVSKCSDYSQNGAKSIGNSKIAILMPEELKQKMETDSDYADKIIEKVATWKKNYDLRDIAIRMSQGDTSFQAKMAMQQGSYLIELDENGDVENYTVTTNGASSSAEQKQKTDNEEKDTKRLPAADKQTDDTKITKPQININVKPDYQQAMAIMGSSVWRK